MKKSNIFKNLDIDFTCYIKIKSHGCSENDKYTEIVADYWLPGLGTKWGQHQNRENPCLCERINLYLGLVMDM